MSKFSIIVPIFNSEKYLEKCIKSILNQTYKNFELILVNDGSKDCSLEICKI
ncbi:Poly-beta-1%2C6-N-acetyl-D-glucosamine synthase [uncultured Clostridium sp.]|nr:glycosyltransferase family 2 protein [Clostridium saudiense]SCJ90984.1 Poly-beta-1%2C6-N-acetyl-D-glucosamine synthase [uncultured Clostridium sp.]